MLCSDYRRQYKNYYMDNNVCVPARNLLGTHITGVSVQTSTEHCLVKHITKAGYLEVNL